MEKDDASHSEKQGGHRGGRCQRMVVMAFVLGAISAIAGTLSARGTSSRLAKAGTRAAPPQAD